jgi:hypothetical protein
MTAMMRRGTVNMLSSGSGETRIGTLPIIQALP